LPDWVPDEPEGVGDGDLLAGIQQLLLFQVKVLQQAGHHIFYIVGPPKKFISAAYSLKKVYNLSSTYHHRENKDMKLSNKTINEV
jgi:hypothetical protein